MVECHFCGLNVFLGPENIGIDTNIINVELTVTDLWPLKGFGGHLGLHLEKKLFKGSDFGELLVCCKVHENLTESIEKPFVAIFWGLNCILTGLIVRLKITVCAVLQHCCKGDSPCQWNTLIFRPSEIRNP